MIKIGEAYNSLCKNNPAGFVLTDFTFFVIMVNLSRSQASNPKALPLPSPSAYLS